jgi:hypothetical protein
MPVDIGETIGGLLGLIGGVYVGSKQKEQADAEKQMKIERDFHVKTILNPAIQAGDVATIDAYDKINKRYFSKETIDLMKQRAEYNSTANQVQRTVQTLSAVMQGAQGQAQPPTQPAAPAQRAIGPATETGDLPVTANPPQPTAAAAPGPRSGLTVTGINIGAEGKTSVQLGRLTENQADAEALATFTQRVQGGALPQAAMEQGDAEGRGMSVPMRKLVMEGVFNEAAQAHYQSFLKAGVQGSRRDLMLRAATLAENAKVALSDPAVREQVAQIWNDPKMKEVDKQSAVIRLTGQSPAALGMGTPPGARERAFEQLTPQEQKGVLQAPQQVIVQTAEGPQAVSRAPGAPPIPKPPIASTDARDLAALKTGYDDFSALREAGRQMFDKQKTNLSTKLREALAQNQRAQKMENFTNLFGFTPEEKKFAAKYNALIGRLGDISSEGRRLSDQDATRMLRGIGDAALGRGQFDEQIRASMDLVATRHNNLLDAQDKTGKDVSKFTRLDPNVGRRIKMRDGSVRVYNGKDWVPEAEFMQGQ